jgi:RNA polymerase sigma-70 factor (ECF subfamily)
VDQSRAGSGRGGPGDQDAARHDAFARYALPEVDVLLRVAMTLTRQPADAEDLVQDTLIRAFRACDRFDGSHPRAWLLTILRNTHANRARGRRPGLLDDPDTHEQDRVSWPGSPPPPSPEDLVLGGVFDHEVARALDELPGAFAAAVRLVDLDGLTYTEAARALGVPPGTMMSRLRRGRARIREHLTRTGMAPPPSRAHRRAGPVAPAAGKNPGSQTGTGPRTRRIPAVTQGSGGRS